MLRNVLILSSTGGTVLFEKAWVNLIEEAKLRMVGGLITTIQEFARQSTQMGVSYLEFTTSRPLHSFGALSYPRSSPAQLSPIVLLLGSLRSRSLARSPSLHTVPSSVVSHYLLSPFFLLRLILALSH